MLATGKFLTGEFLIVVWAGSCCSWRRIQQPVLGGGRQIRASADRGRVDDGPGQVPVCGIDLQCIERLRV